MVFVVNKPDNFQANSFTHCINTGHKNQLRIPLVKYSSIPKGVTYSIKKFNSIPASILKLRNKLIFKTELRKYLVLHTFYSIEEYLSNDWYVALLF